MNTQCYCRALSMKLTSFYMGAMHGWEAHTMQTYFAPCNNLLRNQECLIFSLVEQTLSRHGTTYVYM